MNLYWEVTKVDRNLSHSRLMSNEEMRFLNEMSSNENGNLITEHKNVNIYATKKHQQTVIK